MDVDMAVTGIMTVGIVDIIGRIPRKKGLRRAANDSLACRKDAITPRPCVSGFYFRVSSPQDLNQQNIIQPPPFH